MKRFARFSSSVSGSRLLVSVLLLLAVGTLGLAAELRVKVTVDDTRPLADALVKLHEGGSKRLVVARTANDGSCVLQNLANGRYLLEVEKQGRTLYQGFVNIRGGVTEKKVTLRSRR